MYSVFEFFYCTNNSVFVICCIYMPACTWHENFITGISTSRADDNTSSSLSAISPTGGLDNMTYTGLPEKSHFSTAYVQPMNDLEQEAEVYKEVDNPLYSIGQDKPEANGDMQHSTVPNSDFQSTDAHYEPVHLEGLNPMYASVSLEANGNAAAHYTSDQDEHYSQVAQDKWGQWSLPHPLPALPHICANNNNVQW